MLEQKTTKHEGLEQRGSHRGRDLTSDPSVGAVSIHRTSRKKLTNCAGKCHGCWEQQSYEATNLRSGRLGPARVL